jgi:hypothetical protein
LIGLPFACGNGTNSEALPIPFNAAANKEFNEYWFDGKAELSSYKLVQARYGELREGSAVMVFVTEPFSISKLVKLDNPDAVPSDRIDLLKLNFTRNFETGIYPYSLLTSVFSPITGDKSLKINNSCQEWCGHTFAQLKRNGDYYDWLLHSYFESEFEESFDIRNSISEDEFWNTIRINPSLLIEGEQDIIPAMHFLRFKHIKAKAYTANCTKRIEANEIVYTVDYKEIERKLEIRFSANFPYQIQSWTETYPDGWGENATVLTTTGTLLKSIRSDYWSKNSNADSLRRRELGL